MGEGQRQHVPSTYKNYKIMFGGFHFIFLRYRGKIMRAKEAPVSAE